jgi:hypothetical protein
MAFAGARAHDFSTGGYSEPLCHRFFRFYAFGPSHFSLPFLKDGQYRDNPPRAQEVFFINFNDPFFPCISHDPAERHFLKI